MSKSKIILIAAALAVIIVAVVASRGGKNPQAPAASESGKPALTVTTVTPQTLQWPQRVLAGGSVLAWQEAIIGAEVGGLRLAELHANIGDRVKKGQVLAHFAEGCGVGKTGRLVGVNRETVARYSVLACTHAHALHDE